MFKQCFILICSLTIYTAKAQYFFQRLSSADGLSQSTVQSIIQDHKGFMWFGTMDGLNRYDGYTFRVFRSDFSNANTLSNNDIRAIFEDDSGRFWIGTAVGGVNLLNLDNEQVERLSHTHDGIDIRQIEVNDFAEDKSGTIWVSTLSGLFLIDQRNVIRRHPKFADQGFSNVLVDQQNRVWLASTDGGP
jgi:ligand-binding sensor domain-containing protein